MKMLRYTALFLLAGSLCANEMPNLIRNGSFEEGLDAKGAPKHWIVNFYDGATGVVKLVPEHATEGKNAAFMEKTNTRGSVVLWQKLHLKPNTEYILEVKGRREIMPRWHYITVRQPDTKVRADTKFTAEGGPVPPIRFRTDVKKTLCYVNFGIWGRTSENNAGTIGKLWFDEVVLRELPQVAGILRGIPRFTLASDTLQGILFSASFAGKVTLRVKAAGNRSVNKTITVKPGDNPFSISWKDFPEGEAELTAEGGNIKLREPFMIQRPRL